MSTQTFPVSGMTCGHCVSAVSSELKEIPAVTDVSVEPATSLPISTGLRLRAMGCLGDAISTISAWVRRSNTRPAGTRSG